MNACVAWNCPPDYARFEAQIQEYLRESEYTFVRVRLGMPPQELAAETSRRFCSGLMKAMCSCINKMTELTNGYELVGAFSKKPSRHTVLRDSVSRAAHELIRRGLWFMLRGWMG